MNAIAITTARKNLFKLVEEINQESRVVRITGKHGDVIMLSAEDWDAIAETLYLQNIPGMVESIKKGAREPLSKCATSLNW